MSDITLHFCGDSRLRPIRYAAEAGWLDPLGVQFTEIGGATAVGLRHPSSKTLALVHFKEALLNARTGTLPVFQLGEVDCGFVIWHRATQIWQIHRQATG